MDAAEWTVRGIADKVRSGEASAKEMLALALDRIAAGNEPINAFVHLDADLAARDAARVDAAVAEGRDPGPFAGAPIAVKDIYETVAGMPTTDGSLLKKGAAPDGADSIHVARLRAAGAVIVGRTACSEFGFDSATNTRAWGVTRNPWSLPHTPGGSSGGSAAAVAAGLVPFATASDGGGSTRSPAANCGLVGLKPSMGRIPRPTGASQIAHLGAVTKTVADAARHLDVASGPHVRDRMSLPASHLSFEAAAEGLDVRGLRAAVSLDLGYMPVEPQVREIVEHACADLITAAGLVRVEVEVAFHNWYPDFLRIVTDQMRFGMASLTEEEMAGLGDKVRRGLEGGGRVTPDQVHRGRAMIETLEQQVAGVFDQVDILLTPATPILPYAADGAWPREVEGRDMSEIGAENFPLWANVTWHPSLAVPAGISREGLPVGLLINGRHHRDDVVLRVARLWEQARPWPLQAPVSIR